MENLSLEDIKTFLNERPALGMNGISIEAGISNGHLSKVLRNITPLNDTIKEKIHPLMIKYGYYKKSNQNLNYDLTIQDIVIFFKERPALGMNGISTDANISHAHISKILRGIIDLTPYIKEKLLPVMIKYGFEK